MRLGHVHSSFIHVFLDHALRVLIVPKSSELRMPKMGRNWLSQGDREELRGIFEFVDIVVR